MEETQQPAGPHVAIIGMGPSCSQFLEIAKRVGGRSNVCDQVWAINALGNVFECDMVFHMDDVRIQEIRATARPESNIAAMLRWMKTTKTPVMTSRAHPDYPTLQEFPLEDVLNHLGHAYFNSTAAYAVAYAVHIGASRISCYGMDFTYPKSHDAEKGRGCVEFWLGQAYARGIDIRLPHNTTLMDVSYNLAGRLYGYDTLDVALDASADPKRVKVRFSERTALPTADEIEARYDHSVHPNPLMQESGVAA